jgi:hypothetical protein
MDHQLIFHLDFHIILWAKRKIGVTSRHTWKTKAVIVRIGFSRMLRLPKGMSQWKIELKDHLRLK